MSKSYQGLNLPQALIYLKLFRDKIMDINKELNSRLFSQSENDIHHEEYNNEFSFYSNIVRGDIDAVKATLCNPQDTNKYESSQYGRLSSDKLRNIRYHFVVSTALITRLCVDNGLERELAYTLSDLYILQMDAMNSAEKILEHFNSMLMGFTEKMAELQKQNVYSVHVVKAIDYICRCRTDKITADSVSEAISMNRSYLSTLFKKETGVSISDYIRSEKINAAANMLKYSDISCAQIAEYFGFSSQSHFIKCFRKCYGCTPAIYRKKNFRE